MVVSPSASFQTLPLIDPPTTAPIGRLVLAPILSLALPVCVTYACTEPTAVLAIVSRATVNVPAPTVFSAPQVTSIVLLLNRAEPGRPGGKLLRPSRIGLV